MWNIVFFWTLRQLLQKNMSTCVSKTQVVPDFIILQYFRERIWRYLSLNLSLSTLLVNHWMLTRLLNTNTYKQKRGYSAKECIKWSTSILPWSRVINMNRPNMEFPEFPSEKSRSKAGAWVRKGLVLSDRKRKLSIQIQIQYKRTIQVWSWLLDFLSGANWKGRSWQKISWQAAAPPPFFLPPILTHWYTWCKSALAVVVHLVHIGTPLTKATLTSTSLQNCYSDTLTQLVPTPNQRELLIDYSA